MVQETILILEEDLQLQWILKTYLENKGFTIIAHDTIEKVREVYFQRESVCIYYYRILGQSFPYHGNH